MQNKKKKSKENPVMIKYIQIINIFLTKLLTQKQSININAMFGTYTITEMEGLETRTASHVTQSSVTWLLIPEDHMV